MRSSQAGSNPLKQKSYALALEIVRCCQKLTAERRDYVLSKQLLRSGTSVGANIVEANQAQSRADFIHKLSIALKESVETEYWLNLLRDSSYLSVDEANRLIRDCSEVGRMLTAAIKTAKDRR
jgi:four helix bundle protein